MDTPADFFARVALQYPAHSAAHELATAVASGTLSASMREGIAEKHGLRGNVDYAKLVLDWLLDYSRTLLDGEPLGLNLADRLAPLKRMLAVRPGDFYDHRAAEVKAILLDQLELLLEDGVLEDQEELAQATLQRAFDLGYDQYLGLTRPRYEIALADIQQSLEVTTANERPRLERRLLALRSICALAVANPRSSGALR